MTLPKKSPFVHDAATSELALSKEVTLMKRRAVCVQAACCYLNLAVRIGQSCRRSTRGAALSQLRQLILKLRNTRLHRRHIVALGLRRRTGTAGRPLALKDRLEGELVLYA